MNIQQEAQRATYRAPEYNVPTSWGIGQGGHFCLLIGPKKTQEAQRATYRAPEYNVPPLWEIGQGGHFCLLISTKNTNFVEDIEVLLPVKFRWIPFSGFREVKNVSANQRPGRPSCFSDWPEKHIPWKRKLKSCFLSSFVKYRSAVSEEKSKMSRPIRGQGGHLVFPIGSKNTNLVEDVKILLPVKFRWIPFSGLRGEVENASANQRPGRPSCFPIGPKNTNLVEDVDILLLVKFRWIPFSGFRGEVENVSANQRQGRPSCFSDRPKNTNLVEDVNILLPVKFRWIPFSGFRGEVENVSANQRPGRPSCFSDGLEKHKLGRGHWDLASFLQVSLNSVQRFQRRSRKCEKLTTDGRTTDNAWSQ